MFTRVPRSPSALYGAHAAPEDSLALPLHRLDVSDLAQALQHLKLHVFALDPGDGVLVQQLA